jgi:hypothetical protein
MFSDTGPNAKIAAEPCFCNRGTYYDIDTKTCPPCPRGKYQDESAVKVTECTKKCSVGKYGDQQGTKSDDDCKLCSAGKWSNTEGQTVDNHCINCDKGKYSIAGEGQTTIDVCDNFCSPGKWSDKEGHTSDDRCTECAEGKYSTAGEGETTVDVCDNLCSPGRYSKATGLTSNDNCTACVSGKYSVEVGAGTNICKICSALKDRRLISWITLELPKYQHNYQYAPSFLFMMFLTGVLLFFFSMSVAETPAQCIINSTHGMTL